MSEKTKPMTKQQRLQLIKEIVERLNKEKFES